MGNATDVRGQMAAGTTLTEEATPAATSRSRALWVCAVGSAVAILSWLRVAITGHVDLLWAEDGGTFLAEALANGPAVIFKGYNGYGHLVPRVGAELIALAPSNLWGVANTSLACLLAGLCGAVVFRSAGRVLNDVEAAAAALVVAVVPQANMEAVASMAHVHWFLLYAGVWVVVTHDRRAGWMLSLAIASSPLALLLAPAAWRHWRWVVPAAAWQLGVMAAGGRRGDGGVPGSGYVTDVAGVGMLAVGVAVVAAVLVVLVLARNAAAWTMFAVSVGIYVAAAAFNGQAPQARYAVLPAMLLWASVIIAVSGRPRIQRAAVVLAAVAVLVSFPAAPFRTAGGSTPCGHVAPTTWVDAAPCLTGASS